MNPPFERITFNPAVMGGKACIRGMRITASRIISQLGAGQTIEELLDDFPFLEREDIYAALRYASWLTSGREVDISSARSHQLLLNR